MEAQKIRILIMNLPNRTEVAELIVNGENSYVDFERDDLQLERLCMEFAALMNMNGGYILLGVEHDGAVSGLTRNPGKAEEWVMEVARTGVNPAISPKWHSLEWEPGKFIGIISLPSNAPNKPYQAKCDSVWISPVRVGTKTRQATREESLRLYVQGGLIEYERMLAPNAGLEDLDRKRLVNYYRNVKQQEIFAEDEIEQWENLLRNSGFICENDGNLVPSAAGMLLFGKNPKRYFPQTGITAVAYVGTEKDYDARGSAYISGPLVSLFQSTEPLSMQNHPSIQRQFSDPLSIVETGIIDNAVNFVRRSINVNTFIDSEGRCKEKWDYPFQAVREAIINAVTHREYAFQGTDIELSIYSDRIEIISPGHLPNAVTVEKMRRGYRSVRNKIIKEVLRDYRYIEAKGMGVPQKIIKEMREHNGTEVDLINKDDRFTVRLWRLPNGAK